MVIDGAEGHDVGTMSIHAHCIDKELPFHVISIDIAYLC